MAEKERFIKADASQQEAIAKQFFYHHAYCAFGTVIFRNELTYLTKTSSCLCTESWIVKCMKLH